MKRTVNLMLGLALASLFSLALAQGDVQGIPAEYQGVVTVVIGLLSSVLVQPITAIAKKLGRTEGPTTVMISAGLSLVIAFGFSVSQALATGQRVPLGHALTVALIAFLKANGDYLNRVFSNAKGFEALPAVAPELPLDKGEALPNGLEEVQPLEGVQGLLGMPVIPRTAVNELTDLIKTTLGVAGLEATSDRVLKVALDVVGTLPEALKDEELHPEVQGAVLAAVLKLK